MNTVINFIFVCNNCDAEYLSNFVKALISTAAAKRSGSLNG